MVLELSGATKFLAKCGEKSGARAERGGHAGNRSCTARSADVVHCDIQFGVFRTAVVVNACDGAADRPFSAQGCRFGGGPGGIWGRDGWDRVRTNRRLLAGSRI